LSTPITTVYIAKGNAPAFILFEPSALKTMSISTTKKTITSVSLYTYYYQRL